MSPDTDEPATTFAGLPLRGELLTVLEVRPDREAAK
jgi:hypothetical protein